MSLNEKHGITELSFLTQCYIAVFHDCYAALHNEIPGRIWKKDFSQFSKFVRSRGLGYLCQDLPQLDTILLNGLSSGKVVFTRPMFGRAHKPSFLKGLWQRIFDVNGVLLSNADPTAIFFIRQIACLAKKANITRDSDHLEKAKYDGFIGTEKDLRTPTKRWSTDNLYDSPVTAVCMSDFCPPGLFATDDERQYYSQQGDKYAYYQGVFDFLFHNFDIIEVERNSVLTDPYGNYRMKHGPGATHKTSRYTDKWAPRKYSRGLDHILDLFPTHDLLCASSGRETQASRIVFVPKDIKGPRLIAAEPVMNQYFQQGVYSFIKNHGLRQSGLDKVVDFTRQDLSKDLALRASIDGQISTIDLKDASDRLSLYLIERVFRSCPKFLNFLMSCRTPLAQLEFEEPILLKKFATQGNAATFPLQSITYAAISIATIMYRRGYKIDRSSILKASENVRVFGDDIIVPTEHYEELVSNLSSFDLVVNKEKSFSTGFFRESCGGDYYRGYDVTPIKIRQVNLTSPESYQMLIDVSNDAYRAGLWHLSDALTRVFPYRSRKDRSYPLVRMSNRYIQGGGLFTYGCTWNSHLASRWDAELHNLQLKHWFLVAKTRKVKRKPLSRAIEQQLRDITSPDWNPSRIQRSRLFSNVGWR